jgi:hypothetical protein
MVLEKRFRRFAITFPSVVNAEALEVYVDVRIHSTPTLEAVLVTSGETSLAALATQDIELPSLESLIPGASGGARLVGAIGANDSANLPNSYLKWDVPTFNMENALWLRWTGISSLGRCYAKLGTVDYPIGGGRLRTVNGNSFRTLRWALWARPI